ncbi:MAG: TraB/GumN family protein [Candidatus Solibacter sp.]
MKRRWLSLTLAGLVLAAPLAAQGPTVARLAAPPVAKKALFWKASTADNVVYLLGSIHLGSKEMYPLAKEVEDAFERSTALIVEVDINRVDQQGMQAMILSKGLYSGDDSLWDHVSPETRQGLEKFCEKYSFPAIAMAKFRPWMAALMVSTLPLTKSGMDAGLGIDKYFLDKAGQSKKKVVEAESAEWQIKLLSGFPPEVMEKYLASALEEGGLDKVKKIQDLWISGDAAGLDAMIHEKSSTPESITRGMLEDRNPHMADVAEQHLKGKETAFMVVGAAHMVGAEGVVKLLEKRGYKVERVALATPAR